MTDITDIIGTTSKQRGWAMKISEVKIFPVNEERLKAYVTIVLDGVFVVRDLKIILGNNGLFVAMPSKKKKDGTFRDVAHPLNQDMREDLENTIFAEYEKHLEDMGQTLDEIQRAR
tara:strand:- start:7113 stop:7460 length:348 start_codon:yes stop_codon:yes gene_type:complete